MNALHLLPGCRVERIHPVDSTRLQLEACGVRGGARCPACGVWSEAGHGSDQRQPADLPLLGKAVQIVLRVRRFCSLNGTSSRRTFADRLPGLLAAHARRTHRLTAAQSAVAVALGGEAGARLLPRLAMAASADTLLRLIRQLALPAAPTPTALGNLPPVPGQTTAPPLASPRHLAWLLLQPAAKLDAWQKATVTQVEQDKEVRKAGALARCFAALVQASGTGHRRAPRIRLAALTRWLNRASPCGVQALQTFAAGLPQDLASIEAALTTGWSNGQTEGHVNKLKLPKRQMYGRAKFDLLRRRLLLAS